MDVFGKLEERIDKLVTAYKGLQARVAELEQENAKLRSSQDESSDLAGRIEELEADRDEVRSRLEKVLESLSSLEI